MSLGMEVGLSPGDFVLDGDPASPPLKGQSPQFSSNVRCGQRTWWTKMALGMEVGLGPGDLVFDGDPAAPGTKDTPTTTQFLAHVYGGQTAGWMKTAFGTEVDLGPGHIVLDGVPALRDTGTAAPRLFGPSLLWPRSPISATAELLFYKLGGDFSACSPRHIDRRNCCQRSSTACKFVALNAAHLCLQHGHRDEARRLIPLRHVMST